MANQPHKVTIWEMFRDIFITAINKGQFPAVLLGLLFIILAIRMPVEDLKFFLITIIEYLKAGYLLGYGFSIISLTGWFFHAKRLRRKAYEELERVGIEKSDLQKKQLPGKVKSSGTGKGKSKR
jgi:hypothetical protein